MPALAVVPNRTWWRWCGIMPEISAVPAAAAAARSHVRTVLAGWAAPDDTTGILELIVSELVANAVDASARDDAVIQVRLYTDRASLVAEVWDQAAGSWPVPRHAGIDDESGRGLQMIEGLGAEWGWDTHGGRKRVWAALPFSQPPADTPIEDLMTWPFDTSVPNVARMYDALLGGKDNFLADREAVRAILDVVPTAPREARQNRLFLHRAVTSLATEAGVRQFLDIGAGLPTRDNTHEIAQRAAPGARVVYVDADPVVIAHARAIMGSNEATTGVIEGNLLDPGKIIGQARELLDFTQPVAVLLTAVLHFVADADDPWHLVKAIMDAVPDGSYLVISHATGDGVPDEVGAAVSKAYADSPARGASARTKKDIARFLDGLLPVKPGLVDVVDWHPEQPADPTHFYGGVALKPRAS
jgi:anti-sigma regulatory factor (Ser/Thr protein kinase)